MERFRRLAKSTIASTAIRQDAQGRFCLNDLHKAAGSAQKDRPGYFLARKETKELVSELASESKVGIPALPLEVIHGGPQRGTYVVKELVYAYAMWISPRFNIEVIRAYDAMVTVAPARRL